MKMRRCFLAAGWVLLSVTACLPDGQRTDSVDPSTAGRELSAEAMAQLDSGNVAYRAGDYQQALGHYRRVIEMAPDDATGWFGIYMAQDALGNRAAADSAIAEARRRNPGASLIRDTLGSR